MADSPAGPFSESNIFKPNYIKYLILLILEEFQVYFYMKLTFKIESYGVRSWYFHDFLVSMSNIAKKKNPGNMRTCPTSLGLHLTGMPLMLVDEWEMESFRIKKDHLISCEKFHWRWQLNPPWEPLCISSKA